jgi:hypothetical protein
LRQLIIILLGLIFLTSCDCYQKVSGTVIDSETSKPITGVKVYNKNEEWSKTTTDTLGQFELSNVSGGLGGCPPMTIIIENVAYKKTEISIPAGGDKIIILEKQIH